MIIQEQLRKHSIKDFSVAHSAAGVILNDNKPVSITLVRLNESATGGKRKRRTRRNKKYNKKSKKHHKKRSYKKHAKKHHKKTHKKH